MIKIASLCTAKIETSNKKNISNTLELVESSIDVLGEKKFRIILLLLEKLLKFKMFKEALKITSKIYKTAEANLDRDDLMLFYRMHTAGNAYNELHFDNSIFFEEHIEANKFWDLQSIDAQMMFLNLSLSFKHLKDYKTAINILEKNNQTRVQLATNYCLDGQTEKAIDIYNKLLKNADKDTRVFINFNLYELYNQMDEPKKAIKHLKLGEEDYLKLENYNYKVTRSMILYNFYCITDYLTAYSYLKRAVTTYEATLDVDIKNKLKAITEAITNPLIDIPNIVTIYEKYKKFATSELDGIVKGVN